MATTENEHTIGSLLAAGTLTQYTFVNVNSAGTLEAAGAGARAVGVCANAPTAGQGVELITHGRTKVKCLGAITRGASITSDAAGLATAAAAEDVVHGVALETGAANTIIAVLLAIGPGTLPAA